MQATFRNLVGTIQTPVPGLECAELKDLGTILDQATAEHDTAICASESQPSQWGGTCWAFGCVVSG